jgi:hypothetical protein
MLNNIHPAVYNKTPKKEILWKRQGCVLFARLRNHMIVFQKARKEKMATQNNVKFVVWLKTGNIIKTTLKNVLLNMKDGLIVIQIKFLKIKELITIKIKKKFWKSLKNQERKMDILIQKPIENEIGKKLNVTIMSLLRSNLDTLSNQIFVRNVRTIVSHKLITMTIPNPWTLFGFVANVMEKSIEYIYQRERLSVQTPFGDAIVQTTEETCRGELEAVPPPRNWSVSKLLLKVIDWLRHTAGCSFYQGQCITNDLWIQNLRSTGI